MSAASVWTALVDPASGATYYANSATGATTWDRPAELDTPVAAPAPAASPSKKPPPPLPAEPEPMPIAVPPAESEPAGSPAPLIDVPGTRWSQVWDASSGAYYYANKDTFEVDWNTPAEVLAAELAQQTISDARASASATAAATTVTIAPVAAVASTAEPVAATAVNSYAAPTQDFGIQHTFDRVLDTASGAYYYVHRETQAVQWDVPESWQRVQEMEAQQAAASQAGRPVGLSDLSIAIAERAGHAASKSWAPAPADQSTLAYQQRPATMRGGGGPPPLPTAGETAPEPIVRRNSSTGKAPPPLPFTPLSPTNKLSSSPPSAGAYGLPPPVHAPHHMHVNSISSSTGSYLASPTSSVSTVSSPQPSPAPTPRAHRASFLISPTATAPSPNHPPLPTGPLIGPYGKPILAAAIKNDIHQFALKGFAANHFRRFRTGGFLSKTVVVDVNVVLSWQKTPIAKSLLTSTKKFSSDAVAVFKKILAFMGDAHEASKKVPSVLAGEIIGVGIKTAPLRDEILCQLCKQTKLNPEPLSTAAGWRLLALACAAFAPTRGFQEHLSNYFTSSYDSSSPPETASLARFCQWRMAKTIREGADERLTLATVEEMSRNGVRACSVLFPGDLDYILHCQARERAMAGLPVSTSEAPSEVPDIMIHMCLLIRAAGGFSAKGIFRLAAQREHVQAARALIEAGRFDALDTHDPHTPADVLKLWLREMLTPLVPIALYDAALRASDSEAESVALVQGLPSSLFATLDYLLRFLADLATRQRETMMNEENLAIVFSQDILRTEEKDPVVLYKNSPKEKNFVRHLIVAWGRAMQAQT